VKMKTFQSLLLLAVSLFLSLSTCAEFFYEVFILLLLLLLLLLFCNGLMSDHSTYELLLLLKLFGRGAPLPKPGLTRHKTALPKTLHEPVTSRSSSDEG
jgi:hypothetical protein